MARVKETIKIIDFFESFRRITMESLATALTNSLDTLKKFRQSMEEILLFQQEKMKELRTEVDQFDKIIVNATEDLIRECAKMREANNATGNDAEKENSA